MLYPLFYGGVKIASADDLSGIPGIITGSFQVDKGEIADGM